ncbi:uncharacterized [Tachysurus ichikawai]
MSLVYHAANSERAPYPRVLQPSAGLSRFDWVLVGCGGLSLPQLAKWEVAEGIDSMHSTKHPGKMGLVKIRVKCQAVMAAAWFGNIVPNQLLLKSESEHYCRPPMAHLITLYSSHSVGICPLSPYGLCLEQINDRSESKC